VIGDLDGRSWWAILIFGGFRWSGGAMDIIGLRNRDYFIFQVERVDLCDDGA